MYSILFYPTGIVFTITHPSIKHRNSTSSVTSVGDTINKNNRNKTEDGKTVLQEEVLENGNCVAESAVFHEDNATG